MPKHKKQLQEVQNADLQPSQQFDTTFKDWIRKVAPHVLPLFLPGATYEETLDIEIIKPTMRADKVFSVLYRGKRYIFHIEFESSTDTYLASRLLIYNAVLYHDHHLPVISMIVYPFETKMAESPLVVSDGKKDILTFHFLMLALFKEKAERYVNEHLVSMYPLLPTMQGANHAIMKRAMDELAEIYQDDEVTLAEQFVWMEILLERTNTIALQEKEKIQEQLKMYNSLWEDHPKVKQIRAESEARGEAKGEAKGKAEGLVEGEIQTLQRVLVNIVKARFPALVDLAQQRATQINNAKALDILVQQVSTAPDEPVARWLLSTPVA